MRSLTILSQYPIAPTDERVHEYIDASKANSTKRAYKSDWAHFELWTQTRGEASLPGSPECVARYIAECAESLKPSTLQRRLAAISVAHQAAGYETPTHSPVVRVVMQGIRRKVGMVQRQAAALTVEHVRQAIALMDDSPVGIRNKAILLLGLAGAFRRSELVALDVADLDFREQGLVVTVRRSKRDQEGRGQQKDIGNGQHAATCPVRAVRRWLDFAEITQDAVFRPISPRGVVLPVRLSDRAVARAVKAAARKIGLPPEAFSGHSLRSGFVTMAFRNGVSESDIMRQTGHNSREVLGKYRREAEHFNVNYSQSVGL